MSGRGRECQERKERAEGRQWKGRERWQRGEGNVKVVDAVVRQPREDLPNGIRVGGVVLNIVTDGRGMRWIKGWVLLPGFNSGWDTGKITGVGNSKLRYLDGRGIVKFLFTRGGSCLSGWGGWNWAVFFLPGEKGLEAL
eukprot:746923-Hanusia_phi.AAC.1